MVEEIRKILLYLKRATGKWEFKESELINLLSIRTRFFTPEQTKEFIKIAINQKCLKYENDLYTITCSLSSINLPIDYKPDYEKMKEEISEEDIFIDLINYIIEYGKMNKKEVLMEINKIRENNPIISSEVAALLLAKTKGLNIDKFLDKSA